MELITEKVRIQEAIDRLAAYVKDRRFRNTNTRVTVAQMLKKLGTKATTMEDIAAIAGNDSWYDPVECDECGEHVKVAVLFDDDDDHHNIVLCRSCLVEALKMLDSNSTEE
jgi:hypothetical protein